jgi:hypothetical protein
MVSSSQIQIPIQTALYKVPNRKAIFGSWALELMQARADCRM